MHLKSYFLVALIWLLSFPARTAHGSDFANIYHAVAERYYVATGLDYYSLTAPNGAPDNIHGQKFSAGAAGNFYDNDFVLGGYARASYLVNTLATAVNMVAGKYVEAPIDGVYIQSSQFNKTLYPVPISVHQDGLVNSYAKICQHLGRAKYLYQVIGVGPTKYFNGMSDKPGQPCQPPILRSLSQAYAATIAELALINEFSSGGGDYVLNWCSIGVNAVQFIPAQPCNTTQFPPGTIFGGRSVRYEHRFTGDATRVQGSVDVYVKCFIQYQYANEIGNSPVTADAKYRKYKGFGGGSVWTEWFGESLLPKMPSSNPVPGVGAGTSVAFSYPVAIADCTFQRNPGSLPSLPPPSPPPSCPVGQGGTSSGTSVVDNHQLSHIHEATDHKAEHVNGACGPCGSAGSDDGKLTSFTWRRYHRYRDQDHFGHFGPGVFSNFDLRLQVDAASNTMLYWNPANPLELELQDPSGVGTYQDLRFNGIKSAELLDAAGNHTTDDTTATWAEVLTWNGESHRFELFNAQSGNTSTRLGRLVRTADRAGNLLTLAYADAVTATDAALGFDRSRLWRVASIIDAYAKTTTVTWQPYAGSWVVDSVVPPNGQTIFYDYDRTALIGLNRVRLPDGSVSQFGTQADTQNQLQVISILDAGADDIHRHKTSHVTWSVMDPLTSLPGITGMVPVAPNRLRMVKNGADEVSYQNWTHSYGLVFVTYVYEGGKTASDPGTFMRYETQGGAPYRVSRALDFTITGWQWNAAGWEVVEQYGVTADTRISQKFDALHRRTSYQRNAGGQITGVTHYAENGTTISGSSSTSYNSFNQPLSISDLLGRVTTFSYDANGNRLTKVAAPSEDEESTWSWTYNGRGQPLTATDANGNTTTYIYGENPAADDYKRLVSVIEPADVVGGPQATIFFTYDNAGRLSTVTDPSGRVTTHSYDSRNRPSTITYADTSTETWTYGTTSLTANLLVSHKDRNNNVESFTYDAAGRRTGMTIAGPGGTPVVGNQSWTYLPGKSLVKSLTGNGEVTVHHYDHHLRQIGTTRSPRAGVSLISTTAYDQAQRVTFTQDPYGRRTYYGYDRNDHVVRTVRELVPGALTVPGNDALSIAQAASANRVITPSPAYIIEEQVHDSEGQMRQRIDGRGYRSFYEYDKQGRLIAETASATLATKDPSPYQEAVWGVALINNVWTSVWLGYAPPDPAWYRTEAARTEYRYDDQGNHTLMIKPKAFTRSFPPVGTTDGYWQELPYGTMFRDPDPTFTLVDQGYSTATTYTGRNLVASITEAPGTADEATVHYTYTLTKKKASESDPRNSDWKTLYAYQACCDRLSQITDAAGKITTVSYDSQGNRLALVDPNGTGTVMTYDARNRPLTSTNAANQTTTFAYDDDLTDGNGLSATYAAQTAGLGLGAGADGSAVLVINPQGEIALEIRDGIGRVVRRVDGNLNATTVTYDLSAGNLVETQVTDAIGGTIRQQADAMGRVRVSIDAAGHPTTALFDANGNQVSLRDPNNVGWTVPGDDTAAPGYDLMNRLRTRSDTRGDTVQYSHDRHGNVVTSTDALNQTTTCAFDYRDRKATCTDRVAGVTTYTYDEANHLTRIADADSSVNGVTDYTYDARGLLASETFPAGQDGKRTVRTYTYDNGRRLMSRTVGTSPAAPVPLNEITIYGYDNANRLTSRSYNDSAGNDGFTYDAAGRLLTAVSGRYAATVVRAYTGNSPAEQGGRLTSEQLILGGANAGSWTVGYQYDAANRLVDLSYPTGDHATRSYTARHQLQNLGFAGATVATRTYDDGGRLTSTVFGNSLQETRTYRNDVNGVDNQVATQVIPGVTSFSYAYDANKRITQEVNGIFANQTQQFLAYDGENRLTNWQRGNDTQSWLLSKVGDWQSTTINGVQQARTHSAVHEVTAIAGVPLAYDLKGNLTQNQDGALYAWDRENRLTTATISDLDRGVNDVATYRYDALGRRVQKTAYGIATTFIHAGAQVIHEFDAKIQLPASDADDDGDGEGEPPGGGILQGEGVTRFNFQPSLSPIPSGFFADKGKVFDVRSNAKSYGWLTSARTDTVIRNEHPHPQFDTFNQAWLNNQGTAGTWEIALANGTYAVVVVMGDPASANQTNHLTIEGQGQTDPDPAVQPPPGYQRGDFDGYAVTATVADGRLTLSIPGNALNPKLCFIEIGPQGSSITQGDIDRLEDAITEATQETGLPPFPKPQPSPRQYAYGSYIDEPLLMRAAGEKYYYASNRLYSVAAITSQAGQVVERYKYDAYGKQGVLAENGVVAYKPSDYGQFHGFTGRYHDWETTTAYFRARHFDASLGRFMGRDRYGYVDSHGLYNASFTPNSLDPSGNIVIFVHGIGVTQHQDKGPYIYGGMIKAWQEMGMEQQAMIHFLYGPAGPLDPAFEETDRNMSAAKQLKALVDQLQKRRSEIDCSEPIYIYAYSNGSIVTNLAMQLGMKVEGVVFSGAALDADTRFGATMNQTPYIFNFHSYEDGTNLLPDGAGRFGFRGNEPNVFNVHIPDVDHYVDDGLQTAGSMGRVNGYTEWDSRYMGYQYYGRVLPSPNSALSNTINTVPLPGMSQAYTYPGQFRSPVNGYYNYHSGVR